MKHELPTFYERMEYCNNCRKSTFWNIKELPQLQVIKYSCIECGTTLEVVTKRPKPKHPDSQEPIKVCPGTIVHIKHDGIPLDPSKDTLKSLREFVERHGGILVVSYGSDTEIKTIPEMSVLNKIYESLQRIEKKLK